MNTEEFALIVLAIIGAKSLLTWFYNKICDAIEYNRKHAESDEVEQSSSTTSETTFTSLDGEDTSEEQYIINNVAEEATSDSTMEKSNNCVDDSIDDYSRIVEKSMKTTDKEVQKSVENERPKKSETEKYILQRISKHEVHLIDKASNSEYILQTKLTDLDQVTDDEIIKYIESYNKRYKRELTFFVPFWM